MESTNIKEVVKEKYGEAALRVNSGGSACCGATSAATGCGPDPITSNLYDAGNPARFPRKRCWPRWAAEIQPHWPC